MQSSITARDFVTDREQHPKAPLALTMGDPAGVGPEITARLWRLREENNLPAFCYVGSPKALTMHDTALPIAAIEDIAEASECFDRYLPVFDIPLTHDVSIGEASSHHALAIQQSIETCVRFVQEGQAHAVVTNPINKAVLYSAGFSFPGHTEYLATLCDLKEDQSVMMLATDDLQVIPVTIHVPLADVSKTLTADKIIYTAQTVSDDLEKRFGLNSPRLAIAALNPHAGENGMMGHEETTHIHPAVEELKCRDINVTSPLPADTLFHAEARQEYDAVICMYHDQALIPLKMLDFWGGVNCTLGLPIIRTSPDHGTAYAIAGKGIARLDSTLAAIKMAASMRQVK